MSGNGSKPEPLEVALVVFLFFVIIIALLTILGPQIEALVYSLTGR